MGRGMVDETALQGNKAVTLTFCWSWHEWWLMKLSSHSLSVGYWMRHDWWNCLVSLTLCWPWDETPWLMTLPGVTYSLLVHGIETWLMWLPGKTIKQCHSLPVGHGMRHHETISCAGNVLSNYLPPFGHIRLPGKLKCSLSELLTAWYSLSFTDKKQCNCSQSIRSDLCEQWLAKSPQEFTCYFTCHRL